MLDIFVYSLLALFVLWLVARLFLSAPRHPHFDLPHVTFVYDNGEPSPENEQVLEWLREMHARIGAVPRRKQLAMLRHLMDEGLDDWPGDSVTRGVTIDPIDIDGVPAEWVVARGASAKRRLLYLHGGAFVVGSSRSHRMLTAELSRRCGVSVLAIDYRLMPENARMEAIYDCQVGLEWILENGPAGPGDAQEVYIAGDSAGGNLALVLSAWARDEHLKPVNGVVVFSPSTDSTLSNTSMKANIETDPMLGPTLGILARMPVTMKAFLSLAGSRVNPRNPLISPLFGDLSDLPPTLVQASEAEMLYDDARLYVEKARSQGSPVTLQTWPGMVHVWQMFHEVLPEGRQALDQVAKFVVRTSASASPQAAEPAQAIETG